MRLRFWQPQPNPATSNPDDGKTDALASQMEAIRGRFRDRIRDEYQFLVQNKSQLDPPLPELMSIVHRLAGSASMVGFDEIGAAAARLDDAFAEAEADLKAGLDELLIALQKALPGH